MSRVHGDQVFALYDEEQHRSFADMTNTDPKSSAVELRQRVRRDGDREAAATLNPRAIRGGAGDRSRAKREDGPRTGRAKSDRRSAVITRSGREGHWSTATIACGRGLSGRASQGGGLPVNHGDRASALAGEGAIGDGEGDGSSAQPIGARRSLGEGQWVAVGIGRAVVNRRRGHGAGVEPGGDGDIVALG